MKKDKTRRGNFHTGAHTNTRGVYAQGSWKKMVEATVCSPKKKKVLGLVQLILCDPPRKPGKKKAGGGKKGWETRPSAGMIQKPSESSGGTNGGAAPQKGEPEKRGNFNRAVEDGARVKFGTNTKTEHHRNLCSEKTGRGQANQIYKKVKGQEKNMGGTASPTDWKTNVSNQRSHNSRAKKKG